MPKETFFNLSEEKQEKVMRAAITEFLQHGFEKTKIGDIAKIACVAKGSMYQYFENKREVFLFSVEWATKFIINKYGYTDKFHEKNISIFDYIYEASKESWLQLREEREILIFLQDVFLGKFSSLRDEPMKYWMAISDKYMLEFIRNGKDNGYIRKDLDDEMISLFMTGATLKFKEYLFEKARKAGEDIVDESFESIEKEVRDFVELLKNGMRA